MIKEIPEAIMIHIPEGYFHDGGYPERKLSRFQKFYESMGTGPGEDERCFYHFIGKIPRHDVNSVFICFQGRIHYKAIIVEFIRSQKGKDILWKLPGGLDNRNWMVTTGPVQKAPEGMAMKGFRGFRYTKNLF